MQLPGSRAVSVASFLRFGSTPVFVHVCHVSFDTLWRPGISGEALPAIAASAWRRLHYLKAFREVRLSLCRMAFFWPWGLNVRRSQTPSVTGGHEALDHQLSANRSLTDAEGQFRIRT